MTHDDDMTPLQRKVHEAMRSAWDESFKRLHTEFCEERHADEDSAKEYDIAAAEAAREMVREGFHLFDDVNVLCGYLCRERALRKVAEAERDRLRAKCEQLLTELEAYGS